MNIGCGPLNVDDLSSVELAKTIADIESKLYDFVWLCGDGQIQLSRFRQDAAKVGTGFDKILVELDRELDPLRDAEDLCVLDQLSEGRIGLVLGTSALDDADLVHELLGALDGARVRGVRVFPRPAQLALPVYSERASGDSRATPISRVVRAACLVPISSEAEALSRREEIDEKTPLLLSIGDTFEAITSLRGAMFLRDELLIADPRIRVTTMPPEGIARRLEASDKNSPFHRLA